MRGLLCNPGSDQIRACGEEKYNVCTHTHTPTPLCMLWGGEVIFHSTYTHTTPLSCGVEKQYHIIVYTYIHTHATPLCGTSTCCRDLVTGLSFMICYICLLLSEESSTQLFFQRSDLCHDLSPAEYEHFRWMCWLPVFATSNHSDLTSLSLPNKIKRSHHGTVPNRTVPLPYHCRMACAGRQRNPGQMKRSHHVPFRTEPNLTVPLPYVPLPYDRCRKTAGSRLPSPAVVGAVPLDVHHDGGDVRDLLRRARRRQSRGQDPQEGLRGACGG